MTGALQTNTGVVDDLRDAQDILVLLAMSLALIASPSTHILVARVTAVGAITQGAKVVSAAAGGVQAAGATPANAFAFALTAAADGEFVDILIR